MSRAWTKLINTQLKDLTSNDLAKLGGNMFIDPKAILEFEQLNLLTHTARNLQTPGQDVFADSLQIFKKSVSSDTATIKPSDIYSSDVDANTYLVKLIGYGVTASDASASIDIALSNGVDNIPVVSSQRAFDLTSQYGLGYRSGILLNESNYITITESGGYTVNLIGLYGIVARGGAQ